MQNDIEIYLHRTSPERVCEWLATVFGIPPERLKSSAGKGTQAYRIVQGEQSIPVLMIVQGTWTSVWFNSARTPWASDLACAQSAALQLAARVRCTDGGWQEGDDPDQFLEVTTDHVKAILWHDE